jgi:hypothetical protein
MLCRIYKPKLKKEIARKFAQKPRVKTKENERNLETQNLKTDFTKQNYLKD